ncbi:hypothetical protein BGZ95_003105 [Linnemannia exigua]|uniref:Uncharacterized protein n=1 Tax=Linnemannia exigua TaxID=604196 RepID=A0AAD4D4M6_9FUNG|nr:hypothetical protein BGZ95_003105 [Linnemannia exigua]
MDVYSLTRKQRPTHLTRGELDKSHTAVMTQPEQQQQQHSQLPPEYRQALLEQQQKQQQQVLAAPPTLQEIESKHSQLPPQYRQAVLEQQQREHQQRLLQQQQQQKPQSHTSPRPDTQRLYQSASVSSSPTGKPSPNGAKSPVARRAGANASHQRIASAPHMSSHRSDRNDVHSNAIGPSRAHWKWFGGGPTAALKSAHGQDVSASLASLTAGTTAGDQALDFNSVMGVTSRACTGCFEAYEQWQGLIPSTGTTFTSQQSARGTFGSVSDSHIPSEYSTLKGSPLSKASGLSPSRKNIGHIPDGLLGGSASSNETLGRDDLSRLPKSASDNIAIKTRPVQDTSNMPMPSVPHDWSWSTF